MAAPLVPPALLAFHRSKAGNTPTILTSLLFWHLAPWQWAVIITGALGIGFAKTAINGVGILAISLFAIALPARASVGVVLPILISADVIAVGSYHRRASWPHLWRLFPWALVGIILGWWTMHFLHLNDNQTGKIIGGIILVILGIQYWREHENLDFDKMQDIVPHNLWFTATMGILGGFTTMVANAAGPIMILYLLSTRLPKMEHIGTGAWYFLILNCVKVPFSINLGAINAISIVLSCAMMPVAMMGAMAGRVIVDKVNQVLFNRLAFCSAFIAGLHIARVDSFAYGLVRHL